MKNLQISRSESKQLNFVEAVVRLLNFQNFSADVNIAKRRNEFILYFFIRSYQH